MVVFSAFRDGTSKRPLCLAINGPPPSPLPDWRFLTKLERERLANRSAACSARDDSSTHNPRTRPSFPHSRERGLIYHRTHCFSRSGRRRFLWMLPYCHGRVDSRWSLGGDIYRLPQKYIIRGPAAAGCGNPFTVHLDNDRIV